ncbi:hypothetical protein BpHYR1_034663 [Brachionus plicatilis]|uniref:Secreted protein n=1 Tax=Brachionus plicatilis TaxID=10195 RepID=A0A3M7Q3F4_BRAPC|nr:hypothetical protein BpHYR1_034663 [Brachionus plicatilis]
MRYILLLNCRVFAGAILNLAHVKFNLTCVACAKTVFRVVAMHYIRQCEILVQKLHIWCGIKV